MNFAPLLHPTRLTIVLAFLYVAALVVRLTLLTQTHHDYFISGMAQGELARNIAERRGFVVNSSFWDPLNKSQLTEQRLIDIEEAIQANPPEDNPENFRP